MSMRNWGAYGYGLLVLPEDVHPRVEEAGKDPVEYLDDELGLGNYADIEGEFFPEKEDLRNKHLEMSFGGDGYVFLCELDHYPGLFHQAYANYEEALEEVRGKMKEHLREDFPWEERLGFLLGSIFG